MESKFVTMENSKIFLNGYKTVITSNKTKHGFLLHVYDSSNNLIETIEEESTYCTIFGGRSKGDVESVNISIIDVDFKGLVYCGCEFGDVKFVDVKISNSNLEFLCTGCLCGSILGYSRIFSEKSHFDRIDPKSVNNGNAHGVFMDFTGCYINAILNTSPFAQYRYNDDIHNVRIVENMGIVLRHGTICNNILLRWEINIDNLSIDVLDNSKADSVLVSSRTKKATVKIENSSITSILAISGNITLDNAKVNKVEVLSNSSYKIINHSIMPRIHLESVRNIDLYISDDTEIDGIDLHRNVDRINIDFMSAKNYQICINPGFPMKLPNIIFYEAIKNTCAIGDVKIKTNAKINLESYPDCIVDFTGHFDIKGNGKIMSRTQKWVDRSDSRYRYKLLSVSGVGKITFENEKIPDIVEPGTYSYGSNCKWNKITVVKKLKALHTGRMEFNKRSKRRNCNSK